MRAGAGMTGTADTEAAEFRKIYNLDVVVIPTNMPLIRTNYADVIYKTENEKFRAVVHEIKELYESGHPVLVGTISIEPTGRTTVFPAGTDPGREKMSGTRSVAS